MKLLSPSRVNIPESCLEEWKGGGFSSIHSGESILLEEKDSLYGEVKLQSECPQGKKGKANRSPEEREVARG